ncbi:MAG: EB domain-containing protein [Proteobacteria bacterium]|nr:EB domain-containing protein [Pseudomonadota bacterium]
MDDPGKKEETKQYDQEWQALKSKIQWDNLKTETQNTEIAAKRKEQKISLSTPPSESIPSKGDEKTDIHSYKKVIIVACLLLLAILTLFIGKKDKIKSTPQVSPLSTTENQEERNTRIVKNIVEEYHKMHTYSMTDLFVCVDMAIDVWNMAKTKGINAILVVGNTGKDVTDIQEANHAWVIAEVSLNKRIALETTGGFIVCPDLNVCRVDNPRYFHGWEFRNPKELKDAQDKRYHPCPAGYVFGSDEKCHAACGENTYCTGNSVCVDGQCRGCSPGYYLGADWRCYKIE